MITENPLVPLSATSEVVDVQRRWTRDWYSWLDGLSYRISGLQGTINGGIFQNYTASLVGTVAPGSANEFAWQMTFNVPVTNSLASYEKIGLFIDARTSDPTSYGGGIIRDTVAADLRGRIMAGNMTGRAWSLFTKAYVQPGADGYVVGHELCVSNEGSDEPLIDTTTGKYGLHLISDGSFDATAGIHFINDGAKWHYGIHSDPDAITDYFLYYAPTPALFYVDKDARIVGKDLQLVTGGTHHLTLIKDGSGNLITLNDQPFPTAIGISGGYNADNNLYLTSQNQVQVYVSNGLVWALDSNGNMHLNMATLINAANDAAAAGAGASVGQVYRNGSQLMVRVV